MERLVLDLRIEHGVDFVGRIEPREVYALMNKATLLVVPSRWREAFGLVALEAAQMARPVVASRVGGLTEAVRDRETGLLVNPEDNQAIAQAITRLLENPETAVRMGQNGFTRARTQFAWGHYMDTYEALYRKSRQDLP